MVADLTDHISCMNFSGSFTAPEMHGIQKIESSFSLTAFWQNGSCGCSAMRENTPLVEKINWVESHEGNQ